MTLDYRNTGWGIAVVLILLVGYGPVTTDMYLPSLPSMVADLGTTVSRVQLTLSAFLWGFAAAQLIYGPLSDRFGRKPVLLVGLVIYTLASVGCILAPTVEWLIAGRFAQAVGACAGPVLSRAIVRDIYGPERAAKVLAYIGSAMALLPALAPVLGGWIHTHFGWKAQFIALLLFGLATLIASWWILPETHTNRSGISAHPRRLIANFTTLLRDPRFMGFTLVVACAYAALFSFISGSSFVLIDVLAVKPTHFGFAFMVVVVGYITGSLISARVVHIFGIVRMIGVGAWIVAGATTLMLLLAVAGFSNLWTVVLPTSVCLLGIGMILPNGLAGAIGPFSKIAGSASSLVGFLQMGLGALAGFLVGYLHNGTTLVLSGIMCAAGISTLAVYRWVLLRGTA